MGTKSWRCNFGCSGGSPAAAPATAPATAKTSRRLLGLLAVNGQAEDSAKAELSTAELDSISLGGSSWFPQKMEVEMIDVGVFGSGESEVVVLVGDDDGKGDSLQKGIKKVTRETIKQLGNDLLGSDGALVQPAQITDFPLGTRTPYAKASAPRMLHVSCLSVLISLIASLNLA